MQSAFWFTIFSLYIMFRRTEVPNRFSPADQLWKVGHPHALMRMCEGVHLLLQGACSLVRMCKGAGVLVQVHARSCACTKGGTVLVHVRAQAQMSCAGGSAWGMRCLSRGPVQHKPRTGTGLRTRGWGPLS